MKTYKIGVLGESIKDYCENICSECALIERNIEKLESKRATLYEMSLRLQNDFIEEDNSAKVVSSIEKGTKQ